eukprot:TRINITY_DN40795_c0_g1_i2.p2 TRINITY_DN40795_c0_g1~~TRINITY_DN40795_c0_g1_i2.p2  ORF type:complete len:191 (+),score=40.57 TRINITY_DN40795_c0_g1_i2:249-821(+)
MGAVFVASGLGEMAASCVRTPLDMIKQRQQVGYAGSFREAVRSLNATSSSILAAAFRATVVRDILQSCVQFSVYEYLKVTVAQKAATGEELPLAQAALCGSAAGSMSAVLTTPVDVLKTRVSLKMANQTAGTSSPAEYWTGVARSEIKAVYREKGLNGFFAGATLRGAYMAVGGFLYLGSFECFRRQLPS